MALPINLLFKSSLMLCIIGLHGVLLFALYTLKPNKVNQANFIILVRNEQVTQITFITRQKKESHKQLTQKKLALPIKSELVERNRAVLQAEFISPSSQQPSASNNSEARTDDLNLNLPEAKLDFSQKERGILEKPKNPIDFQTTRFNAYWKPSGTAIDSLKWKSKTVNTVLGLFGGNKKICTDEDKKNSIAECVPDGYRPENDTSLPIQ